MVRLSIKKTGFWLVLGMGIMASSGSVDAGDPEAGKAKSAVCAACHGIDGNSVNPLWPNLAGQHAPYLSKQMRAFRSGERKDPVMSPMAAPLSDEDIDDISAFYASQKAK